MATLSGVDMVKEAESEGDKEEKGREDKAEYCSEYLM